ncbi:MAG: hypothetical protein ACKPKO_06895, partial [Candidatus Fonsibacter sp.]
MMMITPEEQDHAILLKVADDARQGCNNHTQWMLELLSVPVWVEVIPNADKLQRAARNDRQLTLQYRWTMARTAEQPCYYVIVVKSALRRKFG